MCFKFKKKLHISVTVLRHAITSPHRPIVSARSLRGFARPRRGYTIRLCFALEVRSRRSRSPCFHRLNTLKEEHGAEQHVCRQPCCASLICLASPSCRCFDLRLVNGPIGNRLDVIPHSRTPRLLWSALTLNHHLFDGHVRQRNEGRITVPIACLHNPLFSD